MLIEDLPNELLLNVLSYLDPRSLNSLRLSSKRFDIVNDENAWKSAFMTNFHNRSSFTPIRSSWREEYTGRSSILRKFYRGRGRNVLFDAKIGNVTHTSYDPQSARIMCANVHNGLVSITDGYTGRVSKDLIFPGDQRMTTAQIIVIALSKNCIVYGCFNGVVAINTLTSRASQATFKTFAGGWHGGPVISLCVFDHTTKEGTPNILSGGADGVVRLWDSRNTRGCLGALQVTTAAVSKIVWSSKKSFGVILSSFGEVFTVKHTDNGNFTVQEIYQLSSADVINAERAGVGTIWMEVDFPADYAICADASGIRRMGLQEESPVMHFEIPGLELICQLSLDPVESQVTPVGPGSGSRIFAVGTASGTVYIYNARSTSPSPTHRILAQQLMISALAISPTVLVTGSSDGSVSVYDIISGQPLRPLHAKVTKFERIAEQDPARTKVSSIVLDPMCCSGVVAIGGQVRCWDFDPRAERANGKRKGLNRRRHAVGSGTMAINAKTRIKTEIREDLGRMQEEKRFKEKEHVKMLKLTGTELGNLTDAELLDYAKMISSDEASSQTRGEGKLSVERETEDLEAAIRRSLQNGHDDLHDEGELGEGYENGNEQKIEEESCFDPRIQDSESGSFDGASFLSSPREGDYSFEDDLGFAMRLSLAESSSRQ